MFRFTILFRVLICSFAMSFILIDAGVVRGQLLSSIKFFVQDVELSRDFYGALGFLVWDDTTYAKSDSVGVFGSKDLPLTSDPKTGRIITMGVKQGVGTSIVLLGYDRPALASARGNIMGVGTGDILLNVNTDDINYVYDKLQRTGARFHARPARYDVFNKKGSLKFSGYRLIVYDPDGHLVEVFELSD